MPTREELRAAIVKAKADCIVGEVKFKEGDKVEKDDLILVLA